MKTWRCTRDYPYTNPGCIGHKDIKSRQGHYVEAETKEEALADMYSAFPNDVAEGYGFTVEDWTDK